MESDWKKERVTVPDHVPMHPIRSSAAEYLAFAAATGNGAESMEMRYEDENIWLTQKMMAALCDVSAAAVNQHLKTIFEEGELNKEAVIRYFLITASAGKQYNTNHYNLQAIIAVGFKVNNDRAVQFRKWANGIVKDDTIQGWAIDSDRLKNGGSVLTKEYFDHLLEQIRGFGCLSAGSTRRSQISMPPRWITTSQPRQRACSSRRCRTSSTGPSTATQRRN